MDASTCRTICISILAAAVVLIGIWAMSGHTSAQYPDTVLAAQPNEPDAYDHGDEGIQLLDSGLSGSAPEPEHDVGMHATDGAGPFGSDAHGVAHGVHKYQGDSMSDPTAKGGKYAQFDSSSDVDELADDFADLRSLEDATLVIYSMSLLAF